MSNDNNKRLISKLARSGRLTHAYIIIGESEADRQELCDYLAAALLCAGAAEAEQLPCGKCSHCRKLSKKIHPDLIRIERQPDKKELLVDQIWEMSREAYVLPNEADRKVFVIEEAERLNSNAQNAMLKLLEEPPEYACFILLVTNPGSLFDTVRSRCVELYASVKANTHEYSELSREIVSSLLKHDSMALVGACYKAEKLEKAAFDLLIDELYAVFIDAAKKAESYEKKIRCIELTELIEKLQDMRNYNVAAGHCLGLLLSQLT